MGEMKYTYTTKIKQPQTVVGIKLDPKGGELSFREYKTLRKDVYGASLLNKGLLVVSEVVTTPSAESSNSETIPDFDEAEEEGK